MSPSFQSYVFTRGTLPVRLRWIVLGWLAAETVTFLLLVRALGLGTTLVLGLATTGLGIVLARRLGLETLRSLRRGMDGGSAGDGALADGLLAALGAMLLIVPGYLANAVGLALAAPSARRAVARRFGGGDEAAGRVRRPSRTDIIDLTPEEWTPADRR